MASGITLAATVAALTTVGRAPAVARTTSGRRPARARARRDRPLLDGTHLAHTTFEDRHYVFAATETRTGVADLRVIDVTNPASPEVVAKLACGRFQGNLQVSADRKTLILGADGTALSPRCIPARARASSPSTSPTRRARARSGSRPSPAGPTAPRHTPRCRWSQRARGVSPAGPRNRAGPRGVVHRQPGPADAGQDGAAARAAQRAASTPTRRASPPTGGD